VTELAQWLVYYTLNEMVPTLTERAIKAARMKTRLRVRLPWHSADQ